MPGNRHCARLVVAMLTFGILVPTYAQENYPSRPVRLVAPYPPGGSSDVLARVIAQKLTDSFHRQVIVENRPGATGNIGHELVAKAPADGYTLLLTTKSQMVNNPYLYKRLPFDPLTDFSLITLIAHAGHVLVVHPAVPARNVKQLIALARAQPGRLSYGSSGVGSTVAIVAEVFKLIAHVDIVHVPYKGTVLAVSDVVGGQIEMVFSDMVPAVPQIRNARLRALAVTPAERSPALPGVPTMFESGIKEPLPTQWWGIAGPKGIPTPIVNRLNGEIIRALAMADVRQRYDDLGISPLQSTPERFLETVRTEIPQNAKILAAIGLKPE
ncbi:MAG TPA: tripartite tricarboxylate transporter substrate binding protein [Burkholderiales bacterium]|nr:tripartite tricarboxylate transporter substrate binding protein [Burkholderiales bacterium]